MEQQGAEGRPAIAAAVVVHEGRVLIVRRRVSEGRLSWQFPAGAVEPGEAREDAAVRESLEETGLAVGALKLLGERVHPDTGRSMSYTACAVADGHAHVVDTDELADSRGWPTPTSLSTSRTACSSRCKNTSTSSWNADAD